MKLFYTENGLSTTVIRRIRGLVCYYCIGKKRFHR
jgi:hypothetical protein